MGVGRENGGGAATRCGFARKGVSWWERFRSFPRSLPPVSVVSPHVLARYSVWYCVSCVECVVGRSAAQRQRYLGFHSSCV